MMKLVDVPDSKSGVPRDVWVRVPLSAHKFYEQNIFNIIVSFFINYSSLENVGDSL